MNMKKRCFVLTVLLLLSVVVCVGNVSATENQTVIDIYAKSNIELPPGVHQSPIDGHTVMFQTPDGPITFIFADDSLQGYQVVLIEVTASEKDAREWLSGLLQTDKFFSYYVLFKDQNGNEVKVEQAYTVTLPLPSGYETPAVCSIDHSGKVNPVEATYKDGKMMFVKTADMDYFAVKNNEKDNSNPETGYGNHVVLSLAIIMLSFVMLLWTVPKKKQRL